MAKTIGTPNTVLGPGLQNSEPELAKEPDPELPAKSKFENPPGIPRNASESPVVIEAPSGKKQWRFVKNIDTIRPVRFADGTSFTFPSSLFITSDEVLAAKLVSVADKNHIV